MKRSLTPEILDHLPPDDPGAIASRKDLVRINRLLGHRRFMAQALRALPEQPRSILELGAGEGTLLLQTLQRTDLLRDGGQLTFLDLVDLIHDSTHQAYAQLGWSSHSVTGDVFQEMPSADLILANLFLHHFEPKPLRALLSAVQERCSAFIAIETARNPFAVAGAKLLGLIGCHRVTRHDAVVSAQAGFSGRELSSLWLWENSAGWTCQEGAVSPFTHRFVAVRSS
ncbi:MAG: class I SAM-dependent methyltransferase [Verrucomicrobiota bacterium]